MKCLIHQKFDEIRSYNLKSVETAEPFGSFVVLEGVKRNFIHKEENDHAISANLDNFASHLHKNIKVLPVEARRRQNHIQNISSDHTPMI